MINFTDDKRFIAIWFVQHGEHIKCDWLAAAWINADNSLEMQYRFRYFENDPSETGTRNWYGASAPEATEEEIQKVIAAFTKLAQMCAARNESKMHIIKCNLCDGDQALELMKAQSWFHLDTASMYEVE